VITTSGTGSGLSSSSSTVDMDGRVTSLDSVADEPPKLADEMLPRRLADTDLRARCPLSNALL